MAVVIDDPFLAPIGLKIPTHVILRGVRDSTITAVDTALTAHEYIRRRCGARNQKSYARDSAYVVGMAVDDDGRPLSDVKITFAVLFTGGKWLPKSQSFKTGTDGYFVSCAGYEKGDFLRMTSSKFGYETVITDAMFDSWLILTIVPLSKN